MMMLTKTQYKVMQLFVSRITEQFSMNKVAKILNMNVSLAHRAITPLNREFHLLKLNQQKLLSLNYQENHQELAYVEYIRAEHFLYNNKSVAEFRKEILEKLKDEYFIMLLFGSAVEKTQPGDYDFLFIFENFDKVKKRETGINVIASGYNMNVDINVVAVESVYEMASKRNQKNVLNELLNKHLILFGAENFYRLLKNARQ